MKLLAQRSVIVSLIIITSSCNNNETKQVTDTTTHSTIITDSMPVVNPGTPNSESIIKTPRTNDDNVIMPDSAIKSQ